MIIYMGTMAWFGDETGVSQLAVGGAAVTQLYMGWGESRYTSFIKWIGGK